MSEPRERPRLPHVDALDGVRGLAILLVMLFHLSMVPPVGSIARAFWSICQLGGLGVDMFFVLSGFLITGILLDARESPHFFRNFYARRALRIWPLYYAVVVFSLCVLPLVLPQTVAKFAPANRDAVWYWAHLSNFAIARRGAFVHGILDVSWSLAIEEQFYLVWPLLVRFVARRQLQWICAGLIASSWLFRFGLTLHGTNAVAVYTLTFCRLDGLATGALIAIALRQGAGNGMRQLVWALIALSLFGSLLALLPLRGTRMGAAIGPSSLRLLVSGATGAVILDVLATPRSIASRLFELAPLRSLGRYSYALYLFHYPAAAVVRDYLLAPRRLPLVLGSSLPAQLAFCAVSGGLSFGAAWLSWHAYEKRFLRLKRFFD